MTRTHQILHSLLCVTAVFTLAVVGIAVLRVTPLIQQDAKQFGLLIESARGTSMQIHKMAQAYGSAANTQAHYTLIIEAKTSRLLTDADKTVLNLNAVANQAQSLIANSNIQINGNILPRLALNLQTLNDGLAEIKPLLSVTKTQIGNPDIAASAASTKVATAHLASMASHGDVAMANLEGISADSKAVADHYKKVLTKPTTFVAATLKYLGNWLAIFLGKGLF